MLCALLTTETPLISEYLVNVFLVQDAASDVNDFPCLRLRILKGAAEDVPLQCNEVHELHLQVARAEQRVNQAKASL